MEDSYTLEEYSSGCESGWTVYFEKSRGGFVDDDDDQGCVNHTEEEEAEVEDLSMVSDASSGPAQVSQDNNNNTNANCYINGGVFYSVSTNEDGALVRNKKQKRRSKKDRPSEKLVDFNQDHMLDDTASSRPDFNYTSMNYDNQAASSILKMMDLSHDHFSTSYFQDDTSSSVIHTHHCDHQLHFYKQYNR